MMRKLNLLTCIALICCVLINPLGALAEAPWFELYLRLLEKNGQMSDGDQAGEFCLIDVDMDGTPELLLTVWDGKKKATYAHIYRYVNGKAVRCPSIKMGPVDGGGAYINLFRSQTGYAVWTVNRQTNKVARWLLTRLISVNNNIRVVENFVTSGMALRLLSHGTH